MSSPWRAARWHSRPSRPPWSSSCSDALRAWSTRRMIATQVWDDEADAVGSNTIDVHVGRVRAKLGGSRARIETVRGTGYRMVGG